MNKATNYSINFETEEIIITKKFGKAASQIGTPEFKVMQQLRKEFEGFSFVYKTIERKENKKSYKGLSIDEMKRFLSDNRTEEEKEMFEKVLAVAANKQGKYAIVKKWFLDRYKEAYSKEVEAIKAA
ncbi:MAG: hypothetical protein ENTB_02416 [Enterocloster aldenensis]